MSAAIYTIERDGNNKLYAQVWAIQTENATLYAARPQLAHGGLGEQRTFPKKPTTHTTATAAWDAEIRKATYEQQDALAVLQAITNRISELQQAKQEWEPCHTTLPTNHNELKR